MAYVALSRVKQLQNLHLSAFHEEAIKVSVKSLQEVNRLRQAYHPDLPKYSVPSEKKPAPQKRKRKVSAAVGSNLPTPKKKTQRKSHVDSTPPPPPSRGALKRKREIGASTASNSSSPSAKKTENTKKRQSNVKSNHHYLPVLCVPLHLSHRQSKRRGHQHLLMLCVSLHHSRTYMWENKQTNILPQEPVKDTLCLLVSLCQQTVENESLM